MKSIIILVELVLLSFLVFRLFKLYRNYKNLGDSGTFLEKVGMVLNRSLPKPVSTLLIREITMFYYLLAGESPKEAGESFTYHKEAGYKAILIALLSVILLESAGLFFLLHQWSPILSWIHIALNIYGVLYLISDYRAIKQRPILLTDEQLRIRLGSRREIEVPIRMIDTVNSGNSFMEEKKNKTVFKAVLLETEMPHFELCLKEPIYMINLLGKPQVIEKVYVTVDDRERFHQSLLRKMESGKSVLR
ncbi:hypothetical protein JOC95_001798 [Bacillus tianshenii]|uniref:Uncharacterized protein n=1 Tax=Sutcliffiella tianshenii TaxID=1463404 RepID=A0ABS2NZ23_9BACI|nr:hypothetical protein [Bacillus tianshenii]MBM7619946.1 hypothetical protein [Bacillus tianshenii]